MNLANKTILITGASAGIGRATAIAAAACGAKLVITGRRRELLELLAAQLAPAQVHIIDCDVRDEKAVNEALASIPEAFQPIYALINNAGLALGLEPADRCDMRDWQQMIDTNIKGVLYFTQPVLKSMRAHNEGHIINISSIAGTYPYAGGNVYGATKAFITQFSLNLRADLLGTKIRVTNIEPGMAETEFSKVRFKGDASRAETVYQGTAPLTAEDIAETILWSLSRPAHVNINRIELMCVAQAADGLKVHRDS